MQNDKSRNKLWNDISLFFIHCRMNGWWVRNYCFIFFLTKVFFKFYCYDSLGMDIWKAAILTVYLVFATFDMSFLFPLYLFILLVSYQVNNVDFLLYYYITQVAGISGGTKFRLLQHQSLSISTDFANTLIQAKAMY